MVMIELNEGAWAMTKIRSALAVLFFAFAGLCTGTAGAQAQMFNFQVCNQSSYSASVATNALTAPGGSQYLVAGWWTVPAGTCTAIGTFPQGWFYYYAEVTGDSSMAWTGTTAPLCVQYPGPFERVTPPATTCAGDDLKQFSGEIVDPTITTVTWTLN
jgi:uncharacterized membrane protein